ncbi:MAG: outer membrane protein [Parvularculaceae bacterium]
MFRQLKIMFAVGAALTPVAALAQNDGSDFRNASELNRGSVYKSYGAGAFVRAGYIFATTKEGDFNAPLVSGGFEWSAFGPSPLRLETEIVATRDNQDFDLLGVPTEVTSTLAAALVGVSAHSNITSWLSPYIGAGVGVGYVRAAVETGEADVLGVIVPATSESEDDIAFAFTGRTGLNASVTPRIDLQAGYRFLGFTNDGTLGLHGGELGFNYKF